MSFLSISMLRRVLFMYLKFKYLNILLIVVREKSGRSSSSLTALSTYNKGQSHIQLTMSIYRQCFLKSWKLIKVNNIDTWFMYYKYRKRIEVTHLCHSRCFVVMEEYMYFAPNRTKGELIIFIFECHFRAWRFRWSKTFVFFFLFQYSKYWSPRYSKNFRRFQHTFIFIYSSRNIRNLVDLFFFKLFLIQYMFVHVVHQKLFGVYECSSFPLFRRRNTNVALNNKLNKK